jgi:hypothetical protein
LGADGDCLLPPIDAAVVMDELEATPVGIGEIEAFRKSHVLDWAAYLTAEGPSPLEDVLEA